VRRRLLPGTRQPGVRGPACPHAPRGYVCLPQPCARAPAGNQFRAAPHKAVEHLPWTLRRHNLVKAPVPRPVPLVRKVCLEGKWTDRAAPGITLHLLASNLARLPAEPVRRGLCLRSLGRAPSKQPWAHRPGLDGDDQTRRYPRREQEGRKAPRPDCPGPSRLPRSPEPGISGTGLTPLALTDTANMTACLSTTVSLHARTLDT
jgi:hypothetical protein